MEGVVRRRGSRNYQSPEGGTVSGHLQACHRAPLVWAGGRSASGWERHLLWLGAGFGWGQLCVSAWTPFVQTVFVILGLARAWHGVAITGSVWLIRGASLAHPWHAHGTFMARLWHALLRRGLSRPRAVSRLAAVQADQHGTLGRRGRNRIGRM